MANWSHHPEIQTVNDNILKKAGDGIVSFVFTCNVEGKPLEPEQEDQKETKHRRETVGLPLRARSTINCRPLAHSLGIGASQIRPILQKASVLGKRKIELQIVSKIEASEPLFKCVYYIFLLLKVLRDKENNASYRRGLGMPGGLYLALGGSKESRMVRISFSYFGKMFSTH